ncbi:hypothetical protein [Thalassotalea crassostreae]|uniref:hypothetical protein n=1 Tax=Thalassotalea crassostreae TaxID=1763536 RepID=UPI000837AEDD|nr:hypothetical protein [Thalassotalea crassostreae]
MFERQQLIGNWHRSEQNGTEHFSEYAQILADGRFVFTFFTYDMEGTIVDEISEVGDWGLVKDIHFTITKAEVENGQEYDADPLNKDNYQAYKVLELNEQTFTYEHLLSGERFTLSRVLDQANQN